MPWPHTLVSLTGGVRLDGRAPKSPLLAVLGPASPAVVPSALTDPQVIAVITEIAVAGATAWPVQYFAPSGGAARHRVNDWGLDRNGSTMAAADTVLDGDLHGDLAPWLESGRVRWVAPGDQDMVVRAGIDGCPYLDIAPSTHVQRLQGGTLW